MSQNRSNLSAPLTYPVAFLDAHFVFVGCGAESVLVIELVVYTVSNDGRVCGTVGVEIDCSWPLSVPLV